MPSESVCYPAKLSHGHIMSLLDEGVKFIFYPALPYEMDNGGGGDNHYNCPVVATYSEVIKNSVPELRADDITFMNPFCLYMTRTECLNVLSRSSCRSV